MTEVTSARNPFSSLSLAENEEDRNDDDDDDDVEASAINVQKKKKRNKAAQRRRRRSSARFLRLGASALEEDDEEDDEESRMPDSEPLGALYKRAIRLNAENRINAGNSWNLRLIENMDKLMVEEQTDASSAAPGVVNFTKASCTLDASVKIYSYRVDDVHLTSYKVLANLNRNDANTTNSTGNQRQKQRQHENNSHQEDGSSMNNEDHNEDQDENDRTKARKTVDTLESNVANLNINKLDAAYDIDPLFHKMSKTFDEGGAKGLLLANLGVGDNGCNIVFDSKEDEDDEAKTPSGTSEQYSEGLVDITGLTSKFMVDCDKLDLVPQLQTLRQEYAVLEQEGYIIDELGSHKTSRRYATNQQEEKEAELSIHQDFLERSRMSAATTGGQRSDDINTTMGDEYAADDYGGDDDDDDDFGFEDFIQKDADGERYSSISFQNEPFFDMGNAQTTALLDALCSSEMNAQNDYEFFSQDAMEKLNDNMWAGSTHWKRTQTLQRKTVVTKEKKKPATKKKKKAQFVDLMLGTTDQIHALLKPAPKKKRATTADPLQLSKAMQTKYSKNENVLPSDAGMGIEQLSKLFLRPTSVVKTGNSTAKRTVGFHETVQFQNDDFDDGGSFCGDDNDGPGFEFAEDDFQIQELENVRKVDKVRVGYATVAKKVDVKRLKRDLWNELEANFGSASKDDDDNQSSEMETERSKKVTLPLSFKTTVEEMQQSQADATLPFYFICLLHLANEKELRLESDSLHDFQIYAE